MYETAVRTCVASFIRHAFVEPKWMDYYLKGEVKHGFVWTEDMDNLLKTYENQRDKYPTFESFFPEFVTFLNKYSDKSKPQDALRAAFPWLRRESKVLANSQQI